MKGDIPAVGTKAQVWHGTAKHTPGGLRKSDLMQNKHGHIVSKKQHSQGKRALKNLTRRGYIARKGTFRAFHKSDGHSVRRSSRSRSSRSRSSRSRSLSGGFNPSLPGGSLHQHAASYSSS
jgi:hypothetical protein